MLSLNSELMILVVLSIIICCQLNISWADCRTLLRNFSVSCPLMGLADSGTPASDELLIELCDAGTCKSAKEEYVRGCSDDAAASIGNSLAITCCNKATKTFHDSFPIRCPLEQYDKKAENLSVVELLCGGECQNLVERVTTNCEDINDVNTMSVVAIGWQLTAACDMCGVAIAKFNAGIGSTCPHIGSSLEVDEISQDQLCSGACLDLIRGVISKCHDSIDKEMRDLVRQLAQMDKICSACPQAAMALPDSCLGADGPDNAEACGKCRPSFCSLLEGCPMYPTESPLSWTTSDEFIKSREAIARSVEMCQCPTTWQGLHDPAFPLVDGTQGACRVQQFTDEASAMFVEASSMSVTQEAVGMTIDQCKLSCARTAGCKGIEYSYDSHIFFTSKGRCKMWLVAPVGVVKDDAFCGDSTTTCDHFFCMRRQQVSTTLGREDEAESSKAIFCLWFSRCWLLFGIVCLTLRHTRQLSA